MKHSLSSIFTKRNKNGNLRNLFTNHWNHFQVKSITFFLISLLWTGTLIAQDTAATENTDDKKPVKDAFESNWLLNNQTMLVPFENTLEFDINHRFGIVKNGFDDMLGMYAPSNIRLGLSYTPKKNLQLGAGMTKEAMMFDFNLKWSILQQTRSGSFPVFITYYANMVIEGTENTVLFVDTTGEDYYKFPSYADRFSFFHQLIIGRKFCNWFSMQVAPSYSHYNLIDTIGNNTLKHDNIAVSVGGRIKVTDQMSVIFAYDHPLTAAENVKPNAALGVEWSTGSHAFQLFLSPYKSIISQRDIVYNKNDFSKKEFVIGFNITRLWNF